MSAGAGLLYLMLSLGGTEPFKLTRLICKDTTYTFAKEPQIVGIYNNGKAYHTQFRTLDELAEELSKQCGIK